MPESLAMLEQQRRAILSEILDLGDFRSGSITAISGRCGKPNCHCHRPGQPSHGPNYRLTRKVNGKTVSETFASPAEQRNVQSIAFGRALHGATIHQPCPAPLPAWSPAG